MILDLEDFQGKKVAIWTRGGSHLQGILDLKYSARGFVKLTDVTLYDQIRISLSEIESIGLFKDKRQPEA